MEKDYFESLKKSKKIESITWLVLALVMFGASIYYFIMVKILVASLYLCLSIVCGCIYAHCKQAISLIEICVKYCKVNKISEDIISNQKDLIEIITKSRDAYVAFLYDLYADLHRMMCDKRCIRKADLRPHYDILDTHIKALEASKAFQEKENKE